MLACTDSGDGWFVRLSTRSPKDAVGLDRAAYEAHRLTLLDEARTSPSWGKGYDKDLETNACLRAFFRAQTGLQVKSAAEAMVSV